MIGWVERTTEDGKKLIREEAGCVVTLLVEPSVEWLTKRPRVEETGPTNSLEDRIKALEEEVSRMTVEKQ